MAELSAQEMRFYQTLGLMTAGMIRTAKKENSYYSGQFLEEFRIRMNTQSSNAAWVIGDGIRNGWL